MPNYNTSTPSQNTAKLKNGTTIVVNHGSLVWVKGEVEFSRILTKYTSEEIIANNQRRREHFEKLGKRVIDEDPNKLYNAITIKNAQIIPENKSGNGQLNNEEIFIQDKFYTSSSQPGVIHAQFKNITKNNPSVFVKEADGSMGKKPTTLPNELAAGVPVLIGLRIYCTMNNPGISLQYVYCIGDIVYRQSKTEISASNALSQLGLHLAATPASQPSVDIKNTPTEEAVFDGGFDDTGVVAAAPIAPAQPIQPAPAAPAYPQPPVQAQAQVQPPMPSQAAALLNQYVQGSQPNPAQGQGYGTGNYPQ